MQTRPNHYVEVNVSLTIIGEIFFLFCLVDLYAVVDDDGNYQGDDAEDGPRLRTGEDQQRHGDGQRQQ